VVVALTGSTGVILGIRLLEALRDLGVERHVVISEWAEKTLRVETAYSVDDVKALASVTYRVENQAAPIASGSYPTDGMAIVPCSMRTLAAISHGLSANLIQRAADVTIKEGRRLVLVPRETPLSAIHLENMLRLARLGVVVLPPVPAFYNHPHSLDDVIQHLVARTLDRLGIDNDLTRRWGPQKDDPRR
jgi:4-hydroxy-3-polyprenylbenzoate decarboxylase